MTSAIYYKQRITEELEAAQRSAHPNARRVHLALADGYSGKVRAIEAAARRSAFQLVTAA